VSATSQPSFAAAKAAALVQNLLSFAAMQDEAFDLRQSPRLARVEFTQRLCNTSKPVLPKPLRDLPK
jgi:hypothetical protein